MEKPTYWENIGEHSQKQMEHPCLLLIPNWRSLDQEGTEIWVSIENRKARLQVLKWDYGALLWLFLRHAVIHLRFNALILKII